jgi:hypothetical protein
MTKSTKSNFEIGWDAYAAGKTILDNPNEYLTPKWEWHRDGWWAAYEWQRKTSLFTKKRRK